jgi:pyrroline-5-carboxylate reductase
VATSAIDGARLGFLGTGTITSAIVEGLASGSAPTFRILLSPRNAQVAGRLASTLPQVAVAKSNQEMLDCSDILFLAVRPQVARDTLSSLRFRPDHRVISLIATFSREQIAGLVAPASRITRAVPLPTVAAHLGPTAIFPSDPVAKEIFDRMGFAVEVSTEHELRALQTATAEMASYFLFLDTLWSWLCDHGVSPSTAREYISAMFRGLGQVPQRSDHSFVELESEFRTKGGLNEQLAADLRRSGVFEAHRLGLDAVFARIEKADSGR